MIDKIMDVIYAFNIINYIFSWKYILKNGYYFIPFFLYHFTFFRMALNVVVYLNCRTKWYNYNSVLDFHRQLPLSSNYCRKIMQQNLIEIYTHVMFSVTRLQGALRLVMSVLSIWLEHTFQLFV